jgi:hypothetical protein
MGDFITGFINDVGNGELLGSNCEGSSVIFDILSVSVFLSKLVCEVIITEAELTFSMC